MRLQIFKTSKRSLESPFHYDVRGGLPPPTHIETLLKVTFHSVISLPFKEATAFAISCKFDEPNA